MAQIFSARANTLARVVLVCIPTLPVTVAAFGAAYEYTGYATNVRYSFRQPVPFSHKHHVADDGLDCRYCHSGVETSPLAGVPPTEVCMTCHSQLWPNAAALAPVRQSLANNRPIEWNRVNRLPDYVYFDHSIHVAKGVGCSSCHGAVDTMPQIVKAETLTMGFCLDCHRAPAQHLRPQSEIFNMSWKAPRDQSARGASLLAAYHINAAHLTDCSVCHR